MGYRKLGRSEIAIAPLMLGGNVFGWTADEKTSFAILDAFVDAGFNAIDTADVYSRWSPAGGGASEKVIGAWLKQGGGARGAAPGELRWQHAAFLIVALALVGTWMWTSTAQPAARIVPMLVGFVVAIRVRSRS